MDGFATDRRTDGARLSKTGARLCRTRTFRRTRRRSTTCLRRATRLPTRTSRRVWFRRFQVTTRWRRRRAASRAIPNRRIFGAATRKPGTTVPIFGEGEAMIDAGVFPCFDQTTIADLLDAAHVTLEVLYRRVRRHRRPDRQYLRCVPQDSLRPGLAAQRHHAVGRDSKRHSKLPAARKSRS